LAAREHWQALTRLFLKQYPGAFFYHVTKEYAQLLYDIGYYVNDCGTETTLQVRCNRWQHCGRSQYG
jgi:hypothetical protein